MLVIEDERKISAYVKRGVDAGADEYLIKPFALKELLGRLHALTSRSNDAPKSTVLQVADLILDAVTRRVIRAGETVDLTAEEYTVLECLMREPGRVLTRIIIAEHAWNFDVHNQSKRRSPRPTGGSGYRRVAV